MRVALVGQKGYMVERSLDNIHPPAAAKPVRAGRGQGVEEMQVTYLMSNIVDVWLMCPR